MNLAEKWCSIGAKLVTYGITSGRINFGNLVFLHLTVRWLLYFLLAFTDEQTLRGEAVLGTLSWGLLCFLEATLNCFSVSFCRSLIILRINWRTRVAAMRRRHKEVSVIRPDLTAAVTSLSRCTKQISLIIAPIYPQNGYSTKLFFDRVYLLAETRGDFRSQGSYGLHVLSEVF